MRLGWFALGIVGCSDYGFGTKPEPPGEPLDTGSPLTTIPHTTPYTPPVTTPPPAPSCATEVLPTLEWVASAPFADAADPADAVGVPFWDPASDRSTWVPVAIPDTTIAVGYDRAYASTFTLTEIPYDLSLDLESDDGLEVWLNGQPVGMWGGAWQMEGCVNEHANCIVTTDVPPVDVTSMLQVGDNVLTARVSNAILNSWFEIVPQCVDSEDTGV